MTAIRLRNAGLRQPRGARGPAATLSMQCLYTNKQKYNPQHPNTGVNCQFIERSGDLERRAVPA
jgi:hypothetical protein